MGRVLKEATFEEWIEFVFARPVSDPAWYWEDEADRWEGSPLRTLELLAETFERCAEVLEPYDDDQVSQALWMIASPARSDIGRTLGDPTVPWKLRARALEAIVTLFKDCFAVRCSNHLGDFGEEGANPLNGVCYMWWDELPVFPGSEARAIKPEDELVLSIMARTLELPSEACQEAALHGLGHWESHYPDQIHEIIDRFIWANRKIRSQLRNYAYAARHGDIQ
jgi:hypothetical protein